MIKRFLSLLLIITLTGCAGGGSGSNTTQGESPVVPGQNDPIGEELTAAEQLFGQGNGTGATPTELLPRTDNLGFEYLSFGAWGNVYDIKHNELPNPNIAYFDNMHREHYSFITNSENENMNNWRNTPNASLADSVFTGPAVMYNLITYDTRIGMENPCPTCGETIYFKHDPDYGTMQLEFGHDIQNYVLTFIMSNPDNNLVLNTPWLWYNLHAFNDTYDRVHVTYTTDTEYEVAPYIGHSRVYEGYGIKQ